MEHHQVIIVGAGPSGAACAKALAASGIQALILDKAKLPRNKICSGVLFGQSQVLLNKFFGALPPPDVYCTPQEIPSSHILEWSREKGFFPYVWETAKDGEEFPHIYLNIWRRKLDSWLAAQSGAEVRQQTLVRSVTQNEDIRITALGRGSAGGSKQYACKYLVGADGWSSTVRGCIDPQWRDKPADIVVYQEYCRAGGIGSLRQGHWHVFFRPEVGDILCCAHTKGDYLTLCMGAARGKNIRLGMRRFKEFLSGEFQVTPGPVERAEGCMIKQLPPNLGSGRVLLIGEAAGMAYLNGEGISVALDAGYRAGLAIAEALSRGGDALELYRSSSSDILQHMDLCFRKMHFLVGQ